MTGFGRMRFWNKSKVSSLSVWLEVLRQDIRFALRALVKAPAFTAIAVTTLALGVGANTATFSILKAVSLNRLPYGDPDRLVTIAESDGHTTNPQSVAVPTVYDFGQRSQSFEALSLWGDFAMRPIEHGHEDFLRGMRVTYDFFDTLGIKMHLGRSFTPADGRPDTADKLILSYGLWLHRYGGDPAVIGRVVPVPQGSYVIIGVLPQDFHPLHMSNPGEVPQVFASMGMDWSDHSCRSCRGLRLIGRLKRGVPVGQVRAELNSIMRDLAHEYPADYPRDAFVVVTPLRKQLIGRFDTALWILFGAVGLLLLLACANIANLLLARASGRRVEMALRAALGAGRGRLVRQMLTESLVVSLCGGIGGIAVAYWTTRLISHLVTAEIPRADEIGPDASMLLWGLLVSGITGLLFGALPAWQASRLDLQQALRGATTSSHGQEKHNFLAALIVVEIALAFVLVLGVGLFGKSYLRLMEVNAGYDPRQVLTLSLLPGDIRYDSAEKLLAYYAAVVERMKTIPGVETAGYSSTLPLSHPETRRLYIREQPLAATGAAPRIDTYFVSPEYFRTMKIPLLRGRFIEEQDRRGLAPVALVSESCARKQFPRQDPIGRHIQMDDRDDREPWATVVGIVGDVHQYGLDKAPDAAVYLAFAQAKEPQGWASLVVRSTLPGERIEAEVRKAMRAVDPAAPIFHLQLMDAYVAKSLAQRTFTLSLIGVFGGLALILATVGIYGVVSYSVSMRTREVGIRMALGAASQDVIFMILRQVSRNVLLGLAVGLCASLCFTWMLASLLFGVESTDLSTIAAVTALICLVALAASYVPALRAAKLVPVSAMRVES
jgi:putative ABC transport system permease protein